MPGVKQGADLGGAGPRAPAILPARSAAPFCGAGRRLTHGPETLCRGSRSVRSPRIKPVTIAIIAPRGVSRRDRPAAGRGSRSAGGPRPRLGGTGGAPAGHPSRGCRPPGPRARLSAAALLLRIASSAQIDEQLVESPLDPAPI